MKKILITGATGQLGRSLMALLSSYYHVLGTLHRNPVASRMNYPCEKMDVGNLEEVRKVIRHYNPDVVINTAAFTHVDRAETERESAWRINVTGLENIIKCTGNQTRVIQISSDYVFDGKDGPYREADPTYPISYYGKTKLAAENLLRGANRHFLILRGNVLYQTSADDKASFFSWVYTSLKKGTPIRVVTDQISNPTWVEAFSQAIMKCIVLGAAGIYHFGSNDYLSRYEFALKVAEIFGFDAGLITPILTEELNQPAPRPHHSGLVTDKIIVEIGAQVYSTEYCLKQIKRKILS